MILNSKTYTYAGVVGNFSRWAYRALGLPQLFSWATGSVQAGDGKKTTSTVKWRLVVPLPVTESSPCGCEGDVEGKITAFVDINITGRADTAARTDFLAQLRDLLATTEFSSSLINLEQPYA